MDIGQAWEIIDRVLARRLPGVAATMREPASSEDLDRLASTVGRELPADLVASLEIHDGQDNPTFLLDLYDHQTLMSVESMIANSNMRDEVIGSDIDDVLSWMVPDKVRTIQNCRGWLQFTASEGMASRSTSTPFPMATLDRSSGFLSTVSLSRPNSPRIRRGYST